MVMALWGMPWKRPRRCSQGNSKEAVRDLRLALRRMERLGWSALLRARFVKLVRRLLENDPWDGPRFAA